MAAGVLAAWLAAASVTGGVKCLDTASFGALSLTLERRDGAIHVVLTGARPEQAALAWQVPGAGPGLAFALDFPPSACRFSTKAKPVFRCATGPGTLLVGGSSIPLAGADIALAAVRRTTSGLKGDETARALELTVGLQASTEGRAAQDWRVSYDVSGSQ